MEMTMTPTDLEETAIALHDFLWEILDESDDGAMEFSGAEADCDRVIDLLNQLQAEIVARGLQTRDYAEPA
jgi:hypothetical protein